MDKELLEKLKELRSKANIEVSGAANYPFYIAVEKPSRSLSKRDDTQPSHWNCDDALFMIAFVRESDKILSALDEYFKLKGK